MVAQENTIIGGFQTCSSKTIFTNTLSFGKTSQEVSSLQTILKREGVFSGQITGYYGSLTSAAVKKFQAQHGLSQIGIVDTKTRAVLNNLSASNTTNTSPTTSIASTNNKYIFNTTISYGSSGTAVVELQKRLITLGLYSGQVTGYFGTQTRTAVKVFQAKNNISQVGSVGPATRAALNQ